MDVLDEKNSLSMLKANKKTFFRVFFVSRFRCLKSKAQNILGIMKHCQNISKNYWRNKVYLETNYVILSVDYNITAFGRRLVKCGHRPFYI